LITGRLPQILAHSGAVVLMPKTSFSYHFSSRLLPWVHYVPLSFSGADLIEKIEWLSRNDVMARQIALNARNFGKSYLRMEDYIYYLETALTVVSELEKDTDAAESFKPQRNGSAALCIDNEKEKRILSCNNNELESSHKIN
jgi:hypothetical protein